MIHEHNEDAWQIDYKTGNSVVLDVLEEYKAAGKIGSIGVGTWAWTKKDQEDLANLLATGRLDMALIAGGYNIIQSPIREIILPVIRQHDIGLVVGAALGSGIPEFIRQDRVEIERRYKEKDDDGWHYTPERCERLLRIFDICDQTGMSTIELGLRYLLNEQSVHCNICGAQTPEHVLSNINFINKGPLDQKIIDLLDE